MRLSVLHGSNGIRRRNRTGEERLLHDGLCRDYVVHRRFEMLLPNFLLRIWSCFGGSGGSRVQHSILDVSATHRIALGKLVEIDV